MASRNLGRIFWVIFPFLSLGEKELTQEQQQLASVGHEPKELAPLALLLGTEGLGRVAARLCAPRGPCLLPRGWRWERRARDRRRGHSSQRSGLKAGSWRGESDASAAGASLGPSCFLCP